MIGILTGQRHNGLLPEPLPAGIQIAHKTGTLHDNAQTTSASCTSTIRPTSSRLLTTRLPTLDAGRQFIRGVSLLAYTLLEKFASWREVNPLPGVAIFRAGRGRISPRTSRCGPPAATPATADDETGAPAVQVPLPAASADEALPRPIPAPTAAP